MTVSRVLNGSGYVSEQTREKVLQCVEKLNYRPNMIARSLVQKRTSTVGILVCHLENPVYAQYVASISETLRGDGLDIILYSAETHRTWLAGIQTLLSKQVDGLILASAQFDGQDECPISWDEARHTGVELMNRNQTPYVIIGYNKITDGADNWICPDYYAGARMAVEFLIREGHRKIGYFHFEEHWQERQNAFCDAMQEAGIRICTKWNFACDLDSILNARDAAAHWLDKTEDLPTAIFCDNDALGVGVMQALNERGIRVPEDVSVIGNDGNVYSLCTSPRLTTVSIQPMEIGKAAARRLMALLKCPSLPKSETLMPPKFQMGGTVKCIHMEEAERRD